MKRRKQKKVDKGAPKWMVTFSDMMTLILVFFILLFSMSQIDLIKFQAVAQSFKNRPIFDFYPSVIPMEHPSEQQDNKPKQNSQDKKEQQQQSDNQNSQQSTNQDSLNQLVEDIQSFLSQQGLNKVITANRTDRGVVLILQERVLFDTGEASIIDAGKPFLKKVGQLLKTIPNHVKVEGHTDNRPISTLRFPSNWELSSARASSVIRYIIDSENIDPTRFSAVGYGDTRPVVPNNSKENWAKNRRVEIVILDPSYENSH